MVSKSSPPAPDPTSTINAQSSANTQSANQNAELNRINQVTPYGSSSYSVNGTYEDGTPKYTQTTSLSPDQQDLLNLGTTGAKALGNTAVGMLGQVTDSYKNPIDTSGAPGLASKVNSNGPAIAGTINNGGPGIVGTIDNGNYASQVKQAQDAAYRGQTQYLDPQFEQQGKALDNSLINQGITQGSEAYNNAQGNFGRTKQAAYQSAQDAAVAAGNQEQSTLFGQDASRGAFTNAANAQGFNQGATAADLNNSANSQAFGQGATNANLQNQSQSQYLQQLFALRNQPLNEFNSLTSGSQVTNPNFSSTPQANVATTDAAGIINNNYQNQLAQANQQNQGINNLFSLGGTLGGAAITKYSDRRLKRDIERVGTTSGGIPTYTFRYNNDDQQTYFGVMADECRHIPGAVVTDEDGFDMVDYSRVL